jgi:hypothetical protein
MVIDKEVKKKVIGDWQNTFPKLTMYAQNKLYKIVGVCVIGIELIKSPYTESYSPYFTIYSLCGNRGGNDIKACMDAPIVLRDFKNKKGLQYDIPYEKHGIFFDDVIESVKRQMLLSFEGNISFKKLSTTIDEYSKTPPLSAAPNSYLQAVLQEAKLKIALSISREEAQSVLQQINKRNWDKNSFSMWKVDLNEWLQSLQTTISNRDEFLKQIEANKQDKKISQLKSSKLTA